MSEERRRYIQIALFYNCLMLAMGFAALAFCVWLVVSGRMFREGVDAAFLFAAGLVLAGAFWSVPALSIMDGFAGELRELSREVARRGSAMRNGPVRALQESTAH